MEELIRELNNPRNQSAPETINTIQKQIQRLQREPSAWQLGLDLLTHDDATMRFYGALTLTIKINADWDTDQVGEDRELIRRLIENLVSSYVRLAAIPDASFVLQKLSTTLVAVFQKPQSAWALPVRHLTACTIANRYIPQEQVPELSVSLHWGSTISGHQLRSLLLFPMTLAEQEAAIAGSVKEHNVRTRISNNVSDIWKLLHFCSAHLNSAMGKNNTSAMGMYDISITSDDSQKLELARTMLQLVPLWTQDIKVKGPRDDTSTAPTSTFDFFDATVKTLTALFREETLAPAVLQTFTALEESSHRLLRRTIPGYEEVVVKSPEAAVWLEQLVSGDFDPDAVLYMNYLEACMSQVDVTSPEYLSTASYVEILSQVQKLVECDGVAGVEDPVCQVALEILTSVTEGLSDWPDESPYHDSMTGLIRTTCGSLLNKIRIPEEELSAKTQTWDADDRAKFQDFRYDVQDFLQNAFSVLGEDLIQEITKTVTTQNTRWDVFEASLFSLMAFSDMLTNEAERFDKYLVTVFTCNGWNTAVRAEVKVPGRVRKMVIKVLGESTAFLQRHTEFLVSSLNFLFTSLHMQSSATAASRAIYTLCDAQRSMLTEALPTFMESLNNTSDLEADARHRIYAAVGAIIQALPTEDAKTGPLAQILNQLEAEVGVSIKPQDDQGDSTNKAVDILLTMAALGRGLRAPSDTPVDLEQSEKAESPFWITGKGAQIQQQVLRVYTYLLESVNSQGDPLFVEAACDFLRSGFTEDHPSPFKFSNAKVLELLWTFMRLKTPQPDHVMSTASAYLASVKPSDANNQFSHLLDMLSHIINNTVASSKENNTSPDLDLCAATLEVYTRLLPKWGPHFLTMSNIHDILSQVIEVALTLIGESDTLPRRSGASFLIALLEASGQNKITSNSQASANMNATLQTFGPRIVASVVHLIGGVCARSDIEVLAETIRKFMQRQPLMANQLLKEALKEENAVLSPKALKGTKPEQRARFASQIEMLRGSRKSNEVIREFWIACRGSSFEYIT